MRVFFYLPWGARLSSGWSALGQPIELRVHPAERTSNLCMTCRVCLFSDALTDKKMSLTAQSDLLSWDPLFWVWACREREPRWVTPIGCGTSRSTHTVCNINLQILFQLLEISERKAWFQQESGDFFIIRLSFQSGLVPTWIGRWRKNWHLKQVSWCHACFGFGVKKNDYYTHNCHTTTKQVFQ